MAWEGCLIALAAALCYFATGGSAVKCTHCAYIKNGQCESEVCEGDFCSIQVRIDSTASTTLVHKSCETARLAGGGNATITGQTCINVTQGGAQTITCACSSDFCTDKVGGSDVDFMNQLILAENSVPAAVSGFESGNNTAPAAGAYPAASRGSPESLFAPTLASIPPAPTSTPSAGVGTPSAGVGSPSPLGPFEATSAPVTEVTGGSTVGHPTLKVFWGVSESSETITPTPGGLEHTTAVVGEAASVPGAYPTAPAGSPEFLFAPTAASIAPAPTSTPTAGVGSPSPLGPFEATSAPVTEITGGSTVHQPTTEVVSGTSQSSEATTAEGARGAPKGALVAGSAVKCTHCAYINNDPCESQVCEGDFCSIQVRVDSRASTILVHKSCETAKVAGGASAIITGQTCVNITQGGAQTITCACSSDFCTDKVGGSDVDFINQVISAQNLIQGVPENGSATAPLPGPPAATPASPGPEPLFAPTPASVPPAPTSTPSAGVGSPSPLGTSEATSAPGAEPTLQLFWGVSEVSGATTPTAGGLERTTAVASGAQNVNNTAPVPGAYPAASTGSPESPFGATPASIPPAPTSAPSAGVGSPSPLGTSEATSAPGTEIIGGATVLHPTVQVFWGFSETSGATTPTAGGLERTTAVVSEATGATPPPPESLFNATAPSGTANESTPRASLLGLLGELTSGVTASEGSTPGVEQSSPPGNETSTPTGASPTPAVQPFTAVIEPVASQLKSNASVAQPNVTGAQPNASAGLAELQTVVNERVQFFSAVSLQRLPIYLTAGVSLTPDKQHYDVLTSHLDADMLLNPLQLDDVVESERIYLPPRPIHEVESGGGPEPFNGVLIGRDLEQIGAWPQLRPILYFFEPSVDEATKDVVRQALSLWENNTCVSFSEVSGADQYVLTIGSEVPPPDVIACGVSTVGRWPQVNLRIWKAGPTGTGCTNVGTIAHAIGHILGLWHAQSRFDAYAYVYVPSDANGNVDVHPQSASQPNYDVGYDYGSIMHFAEDALRPKDSRYVQTTGQRREPSFIDYKTVNLQQRCTDLCPEINCYVGGYATPPDCTKCHCPTGFGGEHCETVEPSTGECGPSVGSSFAGDDWKEITVAFTGGKGPEQEDRCFWHLWGGGGNQVELQVVNVSLPVSTTGCVNGRTGERNFIEIKIGDNDVDKSFDFQRTGFRLCNLDPVQGENERPIISTNRLIVIAAYVSGAGTFTVRYRNAGGGNPGLAAALHASGLANPVRPGVRVSASSNATAALLFEAGEEVNWGVDKNAAERCDVRRSLVPGDRLASPCRLLRSLYGRYTYLFTRTGRHRIYFNEQYFEPRILIYDARLAPPLKNAVFFNDKNGTLHIEESDPNAAPAHYDPFPYFLAEDRQQKLGPLKLAVTEDGRLVARSQNGTEVTLVCLAHFSCVRLHRRLQHLHPSSNDTRVMLQGGILYSENQLYFATLSTRGEFAIWERKNARDALSTSASKMIWIVGPTAKGRTGQPYRLFIERDGGPSIRDGDDDIVWRVNATVAKDQLPTTLSLSDQGKLTLVDVNGKELWKNE